jgi:hypothetical protein
MSTGVLEMEVELWCLFDVQATAAGTAFLLVADNSLGARWVDDCSKAAALASAAAALTSGAGQVSACGCCGLHAAVRFGRGTGFPEHGKSYVLAGLVV